MNLPPHLSENEFSLFQELVFQENGFYFDESKVQVLTNALDERLQKRGCVSYQEYYSLLKSYPKGRMELGELIELIIPGETFFFRNDAQFEALIKDILPEIVRRKINSTDKSIRVWSAGCGKGDEAYSIAIAIMESLPSLEGWEISILGTDLNMKSLFSAQEASYKEYDIRHLPLEYFDKYFKKIGKNYLLADSIRKMVRFEYHNLAKDTFTDEAMRNLDILFCRNVTIYLDIEITKQVIDNFYDCLCLGGLLFLGHSETLWQLTDKFASVEFPQTFLYKKVSNQVDEGIMKPFIAIPVIDFKQNVHVEETAAKEEIPCSEDEAEKPSETQISPELVKAYILANQGKYTDSANILTEIIKLDNLCAEAYYLWGVILYRTGDLKEAETKFRKVIYIFPDTILAYFNLANIYLYQREFAKASLEFNNAVKLLQKKDKGAKIRFHENLTVEFLLMACQKYLALIAAKEGRLKTIN